MVLQHRRGLLERRCAVRLDHIGADVEENALRGNASISDERVVQLLTAAVDRKVADERGCLCAAPHIPVEVERYLILPREVRVRDVRDASLIEIDLEIPAIALNPHAIRFADAALRVLLGESFEDIAGIDR